MSLRRRDATAVVGKIDVIIIRRSSLGQMVRTGTLLLLLTGHITISLSRRSKVAFVASWWRRRGSENAQDGTIA
ncbi:hypothetical protein M514_05691 [Trichuris suis]|uniref:Uncharacterized protein n=1 Tax=Trichuris suis TaxID=68888 RepID=A0A085NAG1_9BILA|nr:hypothetical protein M513_05691 [Trichuris suis]KFD66457.1 hypothetical protein M514_05691 [Trichuris suis]